VKHEVKHSPHPAFSGFLDLSFRCGDAFCTRELSLS